MPLLTRRAVVLAKIESILGTDPSPTPVADALLVSDPDYTIDPNVLERDYVRNDLSPLGHVIGRKLAGLSFGVELRSNGDTDSGLIADAPKLGRLLRACGYSESAVASGAAQVGAFLPANGNSSGGDVVLTAGAGVPSGTDPQQRVYEIEVTTGGASTVAEVSITPDARTIASDSIAAQTGVTVTSGTEIDLDGAGGEGVVLTFTEDLVLGDKWTVVVNPAGIKYSPVSSGFESITLYAYFDGLLHILTGCMGTFSINAEAGNYAKVDFTFTGNYVAPTDVALPTTGVFESALPQQVELAQLGIEDFSAVVNAFTFDQSNTIVPRTDANAADGYAGVQLTGRDPSGGIDPEATLVASYDFWGKLTAATRMRYQMRIGQSAGNTVWINAPSVQYTGLTYGDREGNRVYDAGLKFGRVLGNDEVEFFFA